MVAARSVVDVVPDFVWINFIFLFLDLRSLLRLSETCKILHSLIMNKDTRVWEAVAKVHAAEGIHTNSSQSPVSPLVSTGLAESMTQSTPSMEVA